MQITPFFYAGSETAQNIIFDIVQGKEALPWHKFEAVIIQQPIYPTMPSKPIDSIELFVKNFIGAINNAELTHLLHLSRCTLYGIHAIFLPSEITQHVEGNSVL